MKRLALGAAAAACTLAGCGGDSKPTPREIVECLRSAGASMEFDPPARDDTSSPDFTPRLTPGTAVVASGTLGETRIDVFASFAPRAIDAEKRALEFLRLFGAGRDHLLKSGTTLVMLRGPALEAHSVPTRDRDTARRCVRAR